jgi:uncharacterized membrane protein
MINSKFYRMEKGKKTGKETNYYHTRVKHLYEDGKLDKNDIDDPDKLRDNSTDEYTRGKINREQFDKLVDDISISYREIKKEIDSLMIDPSKEDKEKERNKIKDDIEDAYAKGKISEQHYNLLNKKIESFVNTNTNKNKIIDNKLQDVNETHITKRSPI